MRTQERALFVEEQVGRVFCSEKCIVSFFAPEIERLEHEYFKRLSVMDLDASEREKLAHLRWMTLQHPDEVWRERTLGGDDRFILISTFQKKNAPIWSVCMSLFLQGEPSFLYLAFVTNNPTLVDYYRCGEKLPPEKNIVSKSSTSPPESALDRLADSWTDGDTLEAQLHLYRTKEDVPESDFSLYNKCLAETLQSPDEVWNWQSQDQVGPCLYHFLRYYPDEVQPIWYIVIARDANEEQVEIINAFPTKDLSLVDRYRCGVQEMGEAGALIRGKTFLH